MPAPRSVLPLLLALAAACDEPRCGRRGYVDADGDGYGAGAAVAACGASGGFADVAGDCDDTRADVAPSAEEDCGPVDRNCDGDPSAGATPIRWYWDRDGDQYGTAGTSDVLACDAPSTAYVLLDGDCDPYDAARSPGEREIPWNGRDDDCDDTTRDDDGDGDGVRAALDCDDADAAVLGRGHAFVDVTDSSGLTNVLPRVVFETALCGAGPFGGAVAIADVDGDGDLDVFFAGIDVRGFLLRNRGDGVFDDVSDAAGLGVVAGATAAVFFDVEGDGDDDLFVGSADGAAPHLYINDSTGTFTEESMSRGLGLATAPVCSGHFSATAADVDDDGDVDLHLPSWTYPLPTMSPAARTFLNDGTGNFVLAPSGPGFTPTDSAGFTSAFADADGDGVRDLWLVGDFRTSALFRAEGSGLTRRFVDVTVASGVGLDDNGMGSALGDFDGDGDLDWFVSSIFPTAQGCYDRSPGCTGNKLYRNRGDGQFDEVGSAAGVSEGGWGWGAAFFDADHDGDLDLAHATGFDTFGHDVPAIRYFEADGTGRFVERACPVGLVTSALGRAVVPFDADGDSDLDLLVTEMLAPPRLFRNDATSGRAGLRIRLSQPGTRNPRAIGAVLRVRPTSTSAALRRDVHANATFAGVGPAEAHVGLPERVDTVHEIVVTWPDGVDERFTDLPVGTPITLVRGVP